MLEKHLSKYSSGKILDFFISIFIFSLQAYGWFSSFYLILPSFLQDECLSLSNIHFWEIFSIAEKKLSVWINARHCCWFLASEMSEINHKAYTHSNRVKKKIIKLLLGGQCMCSEIMKFLRFSWETSNWQKFRCL